METLRPGSREPRTSKPRRKTTRNLGSSLVPFSLSHSVTQLGPQHMFLQKLNRMSQSITPQQTPMPSGKVQILDYTLSEFNRHLVLRLSRPDAGLTKEFKDLATTYGATGIIVRNAGSATDRLFAPWGRGFDYTNLILEAEFFYDFKKTNPQGFLKALANSSGFAVPMIERLAKTASASIGLQGSVGDELRKFEETKMVVEKMFELISEQASELFKPKVNTPTTPTKTLLRNVVECLDACISAIESSRAGTVKAYETVDRVQRHLLESLSLYSRSVTGGLPDEAALETRLGKLHSTLQGELTNLRADVEHSSFERSALLDLAILSSDEFAEYDQRLKESTAKRRLGGP
jgi:hypothetical protein